MIELITSWFTLISKAKRLGDARRKRDAEEVREAERDLEAYEALVRESSRIIL